MSEPAAEPNGLRVDSECSGRLPAWPRTRGSVPRWATAVIIVTAVLTAAGAVISIATPTLLTSSHAAMNPAARVYAGYTFSRDLAIAVFLLALLAIRARRALAQVVSLVGLIQLIDAAVDACTGRLPLVPALLLLAAALAAAAWRLSRSPA